MPTIRFAQKKKTKKKKITTNMMYTKFQLKMAYGSQQASIEI